MRARPYSKVKGKPKIDAGSLLIAQPCWPEAIYEHSAILVLDHNMHGTTGVILNKRSNLEVVEALPELDLTKSLYFGGSSDMKTVCYLHTLADVPQSTHINSNLFWGGDFEFIKDLINERRISPDEIRFYAGMVQWTGGQLEYEIWNNKWWLGDISSEELFAISDKNLWAAKLLSAGHLYGLLQEVPDPSLN